MWDHEEQQTNHLGVAAMSRSRLSEADLMGIEARLKRNRRSAPAEVSAPSAVTHSPASRKYHNTPTNGFASLKESKRYDDLVLLQRAGAISNLECQVKHPLIVNGEKVCVYIADFVYLEDGVCIVEDCKGMPTPVYNLKKKLLRALHGIEIRET